MPDELRPAPGAEPSPSPPRRIFLTGGTGFLGGHLILELLKQPDLELYCLVRARSESEGHARLVGKLSRLPGWQPADAGRLHAVPGDLESPDFGLEPAAFAALASRVEAIVHNGASVNFVAPYEAIRPVNVRSVETCLRLAFTGALKPLHHVSTVGVFNAAGRHELPRLMEDFRLPDPRAIFGGYAQSKWVAEARLEEARRRGGLISIYRPGLITGHSENGDGNLDDFISRLFRGCVQLGSYPALGFELDMSPVDFVSAAIARLIPLATGHTHHLVNPAPMPFEAVMTRLVKRGHAMRPVSLETWLSQLLEAGPDNALYPLIPFLTERKTDRQRRFLEIFSEGACPGFDRARTDAALASSGISCPAVDARLLDTYWTHFEAIGWLPRPALSPAR